MILELGPFPAVRTFHSALRSAPATAPLLSAAQRCGPAIVQETGAVSTPPIGAHPGSHSGTVGGMRHPPAEDEAI